jgi:preprotein translocase subunit SecA/nephrocystin-3
MGKNDSALIYLNRAAEIFENCLGREHPTLAMTYNSLGVLSNKNGDPQQALEYYHRAAAIWEKTLGPDHPNMALVYSNIGAIYYKEEDYDAALQYLQRALDIREKAFGPNHPSTKKSQEKVETVRERIAEREKDTPDKQ